MVLQTCSQSSSRVDIKYCHNRSLFASRWAFDCELGQCFCGTYFDWLSHCNRMVVAYTFADLDPWRSFRLPHPIYSLVWVSWLSSFEVSKISSDCDHRINCNFIICRFNVNYGALGILDGIFATDRAFRKTINDVRHKTLFTSKSAREKFPNPLKQD